ncbi:MULTISPECIES: YqkE family protein [unclassified Peribacillus]|uniref:YqkE family protein n=1 Tax=unclassified Peribacillus TaxID=2675266 RepID=UPI0019117366|nr:MULTISPECIES: YqkE family protein [unclassified Peribacillus]MBK5442442.1 YqkE family protein [Peribacillus sp. TH24]MBK5462809.1 YqkE family protein [Peribacillus sp. TH27]MBK5483851.1 YqkE family protein [Peribacillus sp. TH16]MBK5500991.1 YqkE family protein [Peribacillus sp. TH14]WMX54032.1 YqkE family protein [Peribacillus sp. R9-11]
MKKKQSRNQNQSKIQDKESSSLKLGDMLNQDIMSQLRQKQKELNDAEQEKKAAEEEKKREERKRREKNKSFEELLGESNLNWKNYK